VRRRRRRRRQHISKVRSATLDTWLPEQVALLESIGNRRANLFYEHRLSAGVRRPTPHDSARGPVYLPLFPPCRTLPADRTFPHPHCR
jgi:hypothetical protein